MEIFLPRMIMMQTFGFCLACVIGVRRIGNVLGIKKIWCSLDNLCFTAASHDHQICSTDTSPTDAGQVCI